MKQPEAKSRSTLKRMITFDDSRLVVVEIKKGHEKPVLLYYLSPDTSPDALLKLNSSPRDNNESTRIIVPGGFQSP